MATGFHGLHVIGGLVAFIFLLIRTKLSKFTPAQATAAIVVSYYWHFCRHRADRPVRHHLLHPVVTARVLCAAFTVRTTRTEKTVRPFKQRVTDEFISTATVG